MISAYRAAAKFIEKTRDLFPRNALQQHIVRRSTVLADELMLLGPR